MRDTYVDGEKLAKNGLKMATYYAASFLPHYRRVLFSHLLVFNLWKQRALSSLLVMFSVPMKGHSNLALNLAYLSYSVETLQPFALGVALLLEIGRSH